jgi:hypothetical protein
MAIKTFSNLIMSNLDYIQKAILTKTAIAAGKTLTDPEFKNSSEYKKITALIHKIKTNSSSMYDDFTKLLEVMPKEILERFENIAVERAKKAFFKNNNPLGK